MVPPVTVIVPPPRSVATAEAASRRLHIHIGKGHRAALGCHDSVSAVGSGVIGDIGQVNRRSAAGCKGVVRASPGRGDRTVRKFDGTAGGHQYAGVEAIKAAVVLRGSVAAGGDGRICEGERAALSYEDRGLIGVRC